MDDLIQQAEREAYYSVWRAFRYQSNDLSWEKERLLNDLKKELRVSNDVHIELFGMLDDDETLHRIRLSREGQTGSGNHQPQNSPQPVHDDLHSPNNSAPRKEQNISELVSNGLNMFTNHYPNINKHSGQGHNDDTTGARKSRGVQIKIGTGVGGRSKIPSPPSVKEKRASEDIILMSTDMLINKLERSLTLNPQDPLVVERAKKLLNEQEKALTDAIEKVCNAIGSNPDDSDDD